MTGAGDPLVDPRTFLRSLFDRAVEVADPMRSLFAHLPERPAGRVIVVGAGKASARMAEAVEATWGSCEGLVITRYGHGRPTRGIAVVEAAHPVPDAAGEAATARMLKLLEGCGESDLVLALISGGASSLLVAPAEGLTLADKRAVNAALLASGASIGDMNVVRKHLSRVKGGQLAARAYPARVLALAISDVPDDDPALIGSGPTVGEGSTPADARAILDQWGISPSSSVAAALSQPNSVVPPGDARLAWTETRVIAAPAQSLDAAAELGRAAGCVVRVLGSDLEGEARDVAAAQARLAFDVQAGMVSGDPPQLILSGGELTVTRRGTGTGGPNAEFCLSLALALDGAFNVFALACDTDGIDGAAEVAGAVVRPDTLARAAALEPKTMLDANDSHRFFGELGDQVVTGPTLTNVNDFRAILVTGR